MLSWPKGVAAVLCVLVEYCVATAGPHVGQGFPYSKMPRDIGSAIRERDPRFEPSGIVYHPLRRTLFVCCDNGLIAEITRDGKLVDYWPSLYFDREAITYCPVTNTLFVLLPCATVGQ